MNVFGAAIGMLRAKAFLSALGTCDWQRCASPGVAVPNSSLFKCGCGCGRSMHRGCVIKHNLEITRIKQIENSMGRELRAKAC